MPYILNCRYPECSETNSWPVFKPTMKHWYCEGHRWASEMTNREIAVHIARREKTHSQPGGKFIISLTGEQITELKGQLERFRLGHVDAPVVQDDTRELRKALHRARKWAHDDGLVSIVSMIDRVLGGGPVDLPAVQEKT